MTTHYDRIILGAGAMGASTAYAAAQRGGSTLLIEQFTPGHTRGSSHGDGRILRYNYPEAIYVQMARLAYAAWDRLGAAVGSPFYRTTGCWDCAPADAPILDEVAAALASFDIPYERLDAATSNARFPMLRLPADSAAVYQADGAVVFATKAVLAMIDQALRAGVTLITETRIAHVDRDGARVRVVTTDGAAYSTDHLIVTAGGWARDLLATTGIDLPLKVTQEQVSYYAPAAASPVDHRVGSMPCVIDYHGGDDIFYALPQVDVAGVKAGWHHSGVTIHPDSPAPIRESRLTDANTRVGVRFPHLTTTPFQTTTCLYTNTPDLHFILDRHPEDARIVIAAGFSGHGFKFASVIGDLLLALAHDEPPALPLETFAVQRLLGESQLVRRTGA